MKYFFLGLTTSVLVITGILFRLQRNNLPMPHNENEMGQNLFCYYHFDDDLIMVNPVNTLSIN